MNLAAAHHTSDPAEYKQQLSFNLKKWHQDQTILTF